MKPKKRIISPYKGMTEKEFDNIKLLIEAKLTNKQIEVATGRKRGTNELVRKAPTWADYLKYRADQLARRKARENGHNVETEAESAPKQLPLVPPVAINNDVLAGVYRELRDLNKALEDLRDSQPTIKARYLEK